MAVIFIEKPSEIEENIKTQGVTLLNFYADWCGPCKMMAPIFDNISNEVTVLKVNIDKHRDLAQKYGVSGIPTTFFYVDKVQKAVETGYIPLPVLSEKIKNF